ncbi:MAG: hypothetical protein NC938_02225 [Candidatus Omnitrophica bacterium]|nr:hypothetical protein [Candidatus Omnitrophota bacterium]MCM8790495.1 hypothetical protein [Candidatus Omnitrophota bacterium]
MVKKKELMIVASVLVFILGAVVVAGMFSAKRLPARQPAIKSKDAPKPGAALKATAKRTFSKGMGGLTVRLKGADDKEILSRVRAFKSIDTGSAALMAVFTSNRMQELPPGNYDIEVDGVPQKIYKNITVSKDKETIKDLGRPSGSFLIKALNSKNKEANYPIRIFYPKSNFLITTSMANRPLEIMAGVYDIEIGSSPKIVEEGVRIEQGKVKVLDMGVITGALLVKALDEGGKERRYTIRVKRQDKGDVVATGVTGRPIELLAGTYVVELVAMPAQSKKDIKIEKGAETTLDFEVRLGPATTPAKAAAATTSSAATKAASGVTAASPDIKAEVAPATSKK